MSCYGSFGIQKTFVGAQKKWTSSENNRSVLSLGKQSISNVFARKTLEQNFTYHLGEVACIGPMIGGLLTSRLSFIKNGLLLCWTKPTPEDSDNSAGRAEAKAAQSGYFLPLPSSQYWQWALLDIGSCQWERWLPWLLCSVINTLGQPRPKCLPARSDQSRVLWRTAIFGETSSVFLQFLCM